ncbi:MAG: hydrolase TatD [Dictyoglomus sp. NZ13-RE01]|nr:MAG: hydrolase TatD [Dictyoglomus sp. NZ13-RE01]
MFIDLHTHLNQSPLLERWKNIYQEAKEAGVLGIVVVGYDFDSSKIASEISSQEDLIFYSIGIHPHEADSINYESFPWDRLIGEKTLAIGEIGLDYYKMYSDKESQKKLFREGINFAKKYKLPIIVHCRDAYKDLVEIMREEKAWEVGGIMHSYSGSYEIAKELANWGFIFSFSGPITYPNANRLREVVEKLPLDLIVLETDCPYLPPQSIRGKTNEPKYLIEIAKKLSEIKKISLEKLEEKLEENIKRIFPQFFKK